MNDISEEAELEKETKLKLLEEQNKLNEDLKAKALDIERLEKEKQKEKEAAKELERELLQTNRQREDNKRKAQDAENKK